MAVADAKRLFSRFDNAMDVSNGIDRRTIQPVKQTKDD